MTRTVEDGLKLDCAVGTLGALLVCVSLEGAVLAVLILFIEGAGTWGEADDDTARDNVFMLVGTKL